MLIPGVAGVDVDVGCQARDSAIRIVPPNPDPNPNLNLNPNHDPDPKP